MKKILLVIFTLVSLSAFAQNNGDIVDRLNATLGVRLPAEYEAKVKEFVNTNKIMKNKGVADFTSQFIAKEMENDWKIDKQSQLLFLWHCIYSELTETNLYNGEEGNAKIKEDFNALGVSARIRAIKYKYQKNLIADLNRRSAEAQQRSAEAQQSSVYMIYSGLYQCIDSYTMRNVAYESDIEKFKNYFIYLHKRCKEFNIDYYSLLPTEVQSFYDVSPVQQNSLTCDKAKVKILNIVLQEIVKLYDIYQKAPQAEREIKDIKDYIKDCKKNNIDYKAVLRKELGDDKKVQELLKFYGVE